MSIKRLIAGLAGAPLVAGLAMPALVFAADPVTVTSVDTQGWSTADTRSNGHVNFVSDSNAPLGEGALSLKTDASPAPGQDKAQYMHAANTKLSDVHTLSYYTKQNSASFAAGDVSFQMPVCLTGVANTETMTCNAKDASDTADSNPSHTTTFTTLVYEPYVDQGNAAVHQGEWQQWNVANGKLWSSRSVAGLVSTQGSVTYTLSDLQTQFPDAVVIGFGVNIGSNNPGYDTETDGVVFNDTTYDFEAFQPTGEITSPAAGEHVRGTVTLGATYNDGDNANDDIVQWALRSSCNDNTTTVAGNVDGFNTPYTWDGATFGATVDTSTLTAGSYCFVFNPKDDAGQKDVRLTRTFVVDVNAPVNKDECKNDGWKDFTAPAFKNQGDCVSFIASAGKAKGNPTPVTPVMANNPKF
jgi:hypothetical protein